MKSFLYLISFLMIFSFLGCGASYKSGGGSIKSSDSIDQKSYPKENKSPSQEYKTTDSDAASQSKLKSSKGEVTKKESPKLSQEGKKAAGDSIAYEKDEELALADKSQKDVSSLKMKKADLQAEQKRKQEEEKRQKEELKDAKELYLSADDSNSMASPVIVRQMVSNGRYVPGEMIRTYEFLNYYTFSYPAPEKDPLNITATLKKKDKTNEYTFQAAVRSQDKLFSQLKSFNVTFLMDISGSMAGKPFELSKKFIIEFVSKLKKGNIISIVTCNRQSKIILDSHKINANTQQILQEIFSKIQVNDVTNLEKGITQAYELAQKNYSSNYLNRVIVLSDGATNTGKLAIETIAKHAEDSDKNGIYLAGVGMGEGFNDQLMDAFTDKGRGAYLFIDSESEIKRIMQDQHFIACFDLALKDIRLKLILPDGWKMKEFHGEKVSTKAADIIPQYLAPNSQMIYHMVLSSDKSLDQISKQVFRFEAEYTSLGSKSGLVKASIKGSDLLKKDKTIIKGDAIVDYAEMFKKIKYPFNQHLKENLKEYTQAFESVTKANEVLKDPELQEILKTLKMYKKIIEYGEQFPLSRDKDDDSIGAVLGISPNHIKDIQVIGEKPDLAVKSIHRLNSSTRLMPQEGYKMLAISSGPVGNPYPAGGGQLSSNRCNDPTPEYMGNKKAKFDNKPCYDLHQVKIKLKAPKNAKSFSFDFNFFSAEYPNFVKKNFNDTFFAILEAPSTNKGAKTNISFDSNNNSIEVDNNYFENEFHPIPNIGTGFDRHGSTGWLRTSWPIKGGEEFTITFSIHDEGDGIFDSLTLIDHFQFHDYDAVGTTDPLN